MNEVILALAKAAILVALNQPVEYDIEDALQTFPVLAEQGASFVTLTTGSNESLRGCIGSLEAHGPLYQDIISNAQAAALRDPRFQPLSINELQNITIEVSILSKRQTISYTDTKDLKQHITPFEDGVILNLNGKKATYLPQVWKQLPRFEDFFNSLCLKANLDQNCLIQHPQISVYRVKTYKESK
jgi:AmmeMemoRadiSam system protein A